MISEFYQHKLSHLHVDRSSGHPKPHKVCLLLGVMDLIAEGSGLNNQFIINDELKAAFSRHFQRLKKGNDAEKIIQPFFHLHTDGIWHFEIKAGKQQEFQRLKDKGGTPSIRALFEVIDYAYLDADLVEYFRNELTRDTIKQLLLQNLEDLSEQFHRWLLSIGKSERTANSYVGAIRGTISNWSMEAGISDENLIAIQSYSQVHRIAEQLVQYHVFSQSDHRGKNMYSAALKSYQEFLRDASQIEVTEDIEEIFNDVSLDNTEKLTMVNTRVGQGQYRDKLIKYWHGCAITGYPVTQFLVASHIKPWRMSDNEERLDVYNGLLLLPNLDKAFDLGYISFSEQGTIELSEFIESPDTLGINAEMKVDLSRRHQDYLAYHREVVFRHH